MAINNPRRGADGELGERKQFSFLPAEFKHIHARQEPLGAVAKMQPRAAVKETGFCHNFPVYSAR